MVLLSLSSFAATNDNVPEETNVKMQVKQIISGKQQAIKRVKATFDFYSDSIYDVYVTPDFQTVLKLDPGEDLIDIKNGNSETFNIEQDYGGADNAQYLFITANDLDVTSNIIILTNKRLYLINLYSTLDLFNPIVEFNYPGQKLAETGKGYTISQRMQAKKQEVPLANLDFNYSISTDKYDFTPTSIYNDGVKTVLSFSNTMQEAPVIMVKGAENKYEVVNFEYEKNKIIVHRVIKEAQLIVGKNKIKIKHRVK